MSSFIDWLERVELEAARLYGDAAAYFDGEFAAFLGKLAEEELWHHQLIRSALSRKPLRAPVVLLDDQTQRNILSLFSRARSELDAGTMTREAMLETIVAVEFSEWNEFFVYILHQYLGQNAEHQAAAAEIDRHKHEIIEYFNAIPDGERYCSTLQRLPAMAGKRILIIETYHPLAQLLQRTLASIGEVTLVGNGLEGLSLLENEKFDVVLSNVDMAAIEVSEFFEQVLRIAPQMRDRFVFFSGIPSNETEATFGDKEVTVLAQPAIISHIRRAVTAIAHRSRVIH